MKKRLWLGALVVCIGALGLVAAGCGGGDDDGGGGASGDAQALSSATCQPLEFGLEGTPNFVVASDLPLQGAGREQTIQMTEAIKFIFEQRGWKAGEHFVGYQSCDDSTAQTGGWDSARCSSNANSYANNETVIGVIGTFNSGCAKLVIPVLNRASEGPVGMISPANTYPGLTIGGPGTETGEPDVYYPTGSRNYARVVWTDQFQGAADAQLTQELKLKNVFVLNDAQTYGIGVATIYRDRLEDLGIKVAGFEKWDAKATSYEALGSRIKVLGRGRHLPRRDRLQQRRQADQGPPCRGRAGRDDHRARTASRRSRRSSTGPVPRRPTGCTSAPRASRRRSSPVQAPPSSRTSVRRPAPSTPTRRMRRKRRTSCSTRSPSRTARGPTLPTSCSPAR